METVHQFLIKKALNTTIILQPSNFFEKLINKQIAAITNSLKLGFSTQVCLLEMLEK